MFGLIIGLLSTSYWFLFRFLGLIERTNKLEEIQFRLSKGQEIISTQ